MGEEGTSEKRERADSEGAARDIKRGVAEKSRETLDGAAAGAQVMFRGMARKRRVRSEVSEFKR